MKVRKTITLIALTLGVTLNASSQASCDTAMHIFADRCDEIEYIVANQLKTQATLAVMNFVSDYELARKHCRNSPKDSKILDEYTKYYVMYKTALAR